MSESSSERVGPNGVVVWTDDADGVDKPAWTAMAKAILGSTPAIGARRAAKKTGSIAGTGR